MAWLQTFWRNRARKQIEEIRELVRIIESTADDDWFTGEAESDDDTISATGNNVKGKLDFACKLYGWRKDFIQTRRQLIWIILAFGGIILAIIKLFSDSPQY